MWEEYTWIFVVGLFMSLAASYGMGANDVANAFATSVGAKSISIRQAILIAAFCEFVGAVSMGSHVSGTIKGGIAKLSLFEDSPEVLMFGMLCVLFATGMWLLLASYLEMPVSATHSVVGGIVGMAVTVHGWNAVDWLGWTENFPYINGVAGIVASWFISPLLTAAVAVSIFLGVYHGILKQNPDISRARALAAFPALVGGTAAIGVLFIISSGVAHYKFNFMGRVDVNVVDIMGGFWGVVAASAGVGIIVGSLLRWFVVPNLQKRVAKIAEAELLEKNVPEQESLLTDNLIPVEETRLVREPQKRSDNFHSVIDEDPTVYALHHASVDFDAATEDVFSFLQVFTAMCVSFSHGANDVANSVGPLAAIYLVWSTSSVETTANVPIWILVLGGFGIVLGLSTYGYKIMQAVGVKLVRMSPGRGFAIELSVATVIVFGSRYGIPLSTTHCMIGASVGVGMAQRASTGVNYKLLWKVLFGWVITMVFVGLMTAALFSYGIHSPSINNIKTIKRYEDGFSDLTLSLATILPGEEGHDLTLEALALLNTTEDVSGQQFNILIDIINQVKKVCSGDAHACATS